MVNQIFGDSLLKACADFGRQRFQHGAVNFRTRRKIPRGGRVITEERVNRLSDITRLAALPFFDPDPQSEMLDPAGAEARRYINVAFALCRSGETCAHSRTRTSSENSARISGSKRWLPLAREVAEFFRLREASEPRLIASIVAHVGISRHQGGEENDNNYGSKHGCVVFGARRRKCSRFLPPACAAFHVHLKRAIRRRIKVHYFPARCQRECAAWQGSSRQCRSKTSATIRYSTRRGASRVVDHRASERPKKHSLRPFALIVEIGCGFRIRTGRTFAKNWGAGQQRPNP